MKRPHAMAVIREPTHATPAPIAPIVLPLDKSLYRISSLSHPATTDITPGTHRLNDSTADITLRMQFNVHGTMHEAAGCQDGGTTLRFETAQERSRRLRRALGPFHSTLVALVACSSAGDTNRIPGPARLCRTMQDYAGPDCDPAYVRS